ncbi:MAG TPA: FkbM family methyltransferase [Flavitalea sp.]|nr:FkbM family methyltransferase [Flavitalea sp.]
MNHHKLINRIKTIIFPNGENYVFAKNNLRFKVGSRPIRRKYITSDTDTVRNDVLQIEYMENTFTSSDVLWDIGSHYGHYSIFAAAVVKGPDQVFSFEPDPDAREIQKRNISMNKMDAKINVMDIAISDINGTLMLSSNKGDSTSHLVKNNQVETGNKIIPVKSRTLNNLLTVITVPTFVKIDTEGAEIDILSQASNLLENKNIRFICELHPFAWQLFDVKFEQLIELLNRYNRELTLLDPRKKNIDLPYYGTILF